MDRQLVNNLPVAKGQSFNDCQPGTSRQNFKNTTNKYSNFYTSNSKHVGKNGHTKQAKTRNREPKFMGRVTVEAGRNYLIDSRSNYLPDYYNSRKKLSHNGFSHNKLSIKERFVQANCQFVISQSKAYEAHLKDPDLPVAWDSIEEVIFACCSEDFCCPICLHYPKAAKITCCGHIYCWSCILHYLSLSDKDARSCPICFDTIKKKDLKSVCVTKKIDFATNDHVSFTLMRIRKGENIALPVEYDRKYENTLAYINEDEQLDMFSKLFLASFQQLYQIVERESDELMSLWHEYKAEAMPEVCFVESALQELEQRKAELNVRDTAFRQIAVDHRDEPTGPYVNDYIYFYQSADGQHIYLNSFNIRMLKQQFGELKDCPHSITAKIVDIHRQTVTDEIRKRFPHMRHLPISCEFRIAEVEFEESTLSSETLKAFESEIANRRRQRKRKEKAENRRDWHIDIENKRKIYGINPDPEFKLDNSEDFPASFDSDVSPIVPVIPEEPGPSNFQSSFANLLTHGDIHFDSTVKPKKSPTSKSEDDDELVLQAVNMNTLSDYFDSCVIKTSKKKKKGKK